jgi:transposase
MYLRHTIRKKDGKVHRYWRLVRSVRIGRRVIQQTVAHLGELDEQGRIDARALARLARCAETGDTIILCRSAERRSKEQAMHEKFSGRIAEALTRLAGRIARAKKRIDAAAVNRQIGRILQQNQRAAARFEIRLLDDPDCPAGFRLHFDSKPSFDDWAALSEGAYVLRSNISDWSEQQLWSAYIQLTQAEAAFRIQKDELQVRPVWHQRADRVEAHILVVFWRSCCGRLWSCGSGARAWAIRRELFSKNWRALNPAT